MNFGNRISVLSGFCKAPIYKGFRRLKLAKWHKIAKSAENIRIDAQNPLFIRVSEVENDNETLILLTK